MEEYLESPDDSILQKDLEDIAKNEEYDFEKLNNKTILVTGATGLIGSQIVKAIVCINRIRKINIKVLAFVHDIEKAKKIFSKIWNNNCLEIYEGEIQENIEIREKIDYIIHGASPTNSKFFVTNPVETIDVAVLGTKKILELAKKNNIESMVYLSSLEVYGKNDEKKIISENDYGYIDILNTRSSYSEGKRIVECLCRSYFEEYSVPVKIARLAQTFGPGVNYNDKRVFAEFCKAVIEKRDIVLHTEGRTTRNYCYIKDAIYAIFTILLKGKSGESYNVANKDTTISIKDMANLVCETFKESEIKTIINIPENIAEYGYNPEVIIELNSEKIEKLGWHPTIDLKTMFINTVKSMKERKEQRLE